MSKELKLRLKFPDNPDLFLRGEMPVTYYCYSPEVTGNQVEIIQNDWDRIHRLKKIYSVKVNILKWDNVGIMAAADLTFGVWYYDVNRREYTWLKVREFAAQYISPYEEEFKTFSFPFDKRLRGIGFNKKTKAFLEVKGVPSLDIEIVLIGK